MTVRNETKSTIAVQVRLPGNAQFGDDLTLEPAEERTILKYEERRSASQPVESLVSGIRVVAGQCQETLETADVASSATRTDRPRRWTVAVTPALMSAHGCPARP